MLTKSLEMTHPDQALLDMTPVPDLEIVAASLADAGTIRALYQAVARECLWTERSGWETADFEKQISQERVRIWLAKLDGKPAGLLETYHYQDNRIQIIYFGFLSQYCFRGIGKHLLSHAIDEAWKCRPGKIVLCTRTYDSAHALNNYLKRGFHITKVRPQIIDVPSEMRDCVAVLVTNAKKRGVYPSFVRRVEAYLRACWLGQTARSLFYRMKRDI